jgi:hypothetical protein
VSKDVEFDLRQVITTAFLRPRPGSTPRDDGSFAEEDTEVGIMFAIGCVSAAPVLDGSGNRRGVAVPIAIFVKPAQEVHDLAAAALGITKAPPGGLVAV